MATRARATRPGDTNHPQDTRMQREEAQRQLEMEQQQRTRELSMITAQQTADDRDGLFDPQTGELLESGLSEEQEQAVRDEVQFAEGDDIIEPEVASKNHPGEHRVRTDGPPMGPNGVPIVQDSGEDADDSVIDFTDGTQARPIEASPQPLPAQPARQVQRITRQNQLSVVRVNSDLDMTFGQGENNRWKLQKGRRYRLPVDVADHLHEKGLVATWG